MRFSLRFISFAFLIAIFLLAANPTLPAQERGPATTAAAIEILPSAPEPQSVAVSAESVDDESAGGQSRAQRKPASTADAAPANIGGTVGDGNGGIVPGANVVLEGASASDRQAVVASDSGGFQFNGLRPGVPYHITVTADGFVNWKSPAITLTSGQYLLLQDITLKLKGSDTSVTVYATQEQIATQQVIVEEHQRVLGIFPNFYVTYDANPVPLTTKLKFRLAYKADTDFMTYFGVAFLAAIYQAGDIPNYGQGWDAYGKRVAAGYADTTTDIFLGGAILPWLLKQDPRYFYQGTGTTKSRLRHAMLSPFVCKGDNGKTQVNYSSMGGDLLSGAISNFYYPESNRGAGLVFQGWAVTTGVRVVDGIVQEFVLRKLTPSAKKRQP